MRILAIRGENLASLLDPFEVDFEAEPIRSSGIFAITGPTGAGKTTILDGICLALFDRLPRMDTAERGTLIGRADGEVGQQVKSDDVRGILRHGAGAGYAEVDFVGQDGRRYRSRWEVKRAHGRATGKFQNQRITLADIGSGELIGDKKTDTLQEIEKRIGLSFDQFRRSVLLAQGDFDTFIKASSKDRAELLERITGTEIYSQISRAAFARAKIEGEALRDLETQLGEHRPFKDEERAAVEERAKNARKKVDHIDVERVAIGKAQEWHDTKSRLDKRVTEGSATLRQALESDQGAETDRAALVMAKKAFSLRAELETAVLTSRKLAAAEKALNDGLYAAQNAINKRAQAVLVSDTTRAEFDAKRAAFYAIGPELDKAQRLDAVIEAAETDLANRKSLLEKGVVEKNTARKVIEDIEVALKSARERHENESRWLEEHKSVEVLSVRIEDVVKDFAERITLESGIGSTSSTVEELKRGVKTAQVSRLDKEAEVVMLHNLEHELNTRIATFRKISDAIDTAAVEVKRDKIRSIQAALDAAQDAAEDAGKGHAEIATANEEVARQDSLLRQAVEMIAQVDTELPTNTARLDEARRSLDLSEAAGSKAAEHLRLKLEDGKPCPVCGATEHPVTDVDRLLKDRVSTDQRRVADLEVKVSASRASRTRAETQIAAVPDVVQAIATRKLRHEGELEEARKKWRVSVAAVLTSCSEIGAPVPIFAEDAAEAEAAGTINPIRGELEKLLAETKQTIKRVTEAEAEVRTLISNREVIRVGLSTVSGEIVKLSEEEYSKASEAGMLGATLQGMQQNLDGLCSRLDTALVPVFSDWRERVAKIGTAFIEVCHSLVDQWRECRKGIDLVGTEISHFEAELEGGRAKLQVLAAAVGKAEKQHEDKKEELDKLIAERVNVIEGRPTREVRNEYQERSDASEKAWKEAEATTSMAGQISAAMMSNADAARKALEGAKIDHESAEGLLMEKLHTCEISRVQAESAITKGETWVAGEQARLDILREAVATARAMLIERQQLANEHEAAGRPEKTREEIAAMVTDIEERRVKASAEFIEASSMLLNDDQALCRMAEIKATLDERKEKARVWGQLDDLIGSSDGTKFRRFAQSLTLNHLIHLANRHLADLHPRYELQRAAGSDLVLQVIDRNMADEVRGVHNLSGGESFLVSLSLALGLASMSSSRGIRVDSLFIDEGFGSLDSDSLAMAVAVLEQLQATGRQVGVISHVDELKERIAVKVEVTPVGSGRSKVQVVTG